MRLNYFVFLDVDQTILLKDKDRNHVLNQPLLDQLKANGYMNVYLFTNMDLGDHEHLINAYEVPDLPRRLSRQEIVDELERQEFRVFGVITPADVGYKKGPGAAFTDLYKPAYKKLAAKIAQGALNCDQERIDHRERNQKYGAYFPSKPANYQQSPFAFNKQAMFLCCLESLFLKGDAHILYLDDDSDCLEAVNAIQDKNNVRITTGLIEDGLLKGEEGLLSFYPLAAALKMLCDVAKEVNIKLPKSAKEFITSAGAFHASTNKLRSVHDLLLEYIVLKLKARPKPSLFLMILLRQITGNEVTNENFDASLKAAIASSQAAVVSGSSTPNRLLASSYFASSGFAFSGVATSSAAPDSPAPSCYVPMQAKKG